MHGPCRALIQYIIGTAASDGATAMCHDVGMGRCKIGTIPQGIAKFRFKDTVTVYGMCDPVYTYMGPRSNHWPGNVNTCPCNYN